MAIIVACFAAVAYDAATRPGVPFDGWELNFDEARAKAKATGRNMLIAFYMQGCPPCMAMDRLVLSTRTVKRALRKLVPVRVDVFSGDIAERYRVQATPTFLLTNSAGEVLARHEGMMAAREFVAFLEQASAG